MNGAAYAAVDLGAESGRVVLGRIDGDRASLEVVHRFPNRPVRLPDGLHWDLPALLPGVLEGLARASSMAPLQGVAVDGWGVDYALLDGGGRLLGLPYHHRDARTAGVVDEVHQRVSRAELYATTGIQTMSINTAFQLFSERHGPALAAAQRIALVPDLFAYWLSGVLANELTAASTTGLLDARTGTWAAAVIDRLGLPGAPFPAEPIAPGTTLGPLLGCHAEHVPHASPVAVHAIGGHDTASAFAGSPGRGPRSAILSSGTWSLIGLELEQPILSDAACALNVTNERGVDGTIRLLCNVTGLWLLQECRRSWELAGTSYDYDQLERLAADAPPDPPLFDPDDPRFLAPGDMPARVRAACRDGGQDPPQTPGEVVRSVLASLACKYRLVLERLERVSGVGVDVLHVIGGGARNALACQMTAQVLGRPVLAGPVEATALGNVLMQARATGELGSPAQMREVAARNAPVTAFEPGVERGRFEELYGRFLDTTGLAVEPAERVAA